MTAPSSGGWAAAANPAGDTAYRTQSLKYIPIEVTLDETVSPLVLRILFFRAAAVSFLFFLVVLVLSLIISAKHIGTGVTVDVILSFILFWFVLLFPTVEEPISEWRSLLEDKAGAADSAYAAIYGSLARRRIPVQAAASRIRSDVLSREVVNSRLIIKERSYTAFASVFPYGTSLYVGWTMFRARRGYTLFGQFIKDIFGGLLGRTGLINQMLRTEKVRAMREALHSAVREGAETAIQGIQVSIVSTFGYEVPIQDVGGLGAPALPTGLPAVPAQPSAPPATGF